MNALRSYPAHSCVPMSQILHTSSIILLLCSSNTPQNNTNMAPSLFSFDLPLSSSPLYLSLGYLAVFPCNHLYSVGARLILPSSVATYNTALKLPKLVHLAAKVGPRCPTLPSMHGGGGSPFLFHCDDLRVYHFTDYY